jgi:hypothetical protein
VKQSDFPTGKELLDGVECRIPRHIPAHEVAVANALGEGILAKNCEGDVPRMGVRELCDLGCNPRATFALLGCRVTRMPHEVVRNELSASFKGIEHAERTVGSEKRECGVYFNHRQAPPSALLKIA